MKDNFSKQADLYAKYRPEYPNELYDFILSRCKERSRAWDCATGSGQVAKELSNHFENIEATDISQKQLDNAYLAHNIHYSISKAESTNFPDSHFDLITVGQALHWFNFEAFFNEVKRVLKPSGTLTVWGYNNMLINPEIDEINLDFYQNITGSYWDEERKHIDNHYSDIYFPFRKIESKPFEITKEWDLPTLEGFFKTWSAVQHFINKEGYSPVPKLIDQFRTIWNEGEIKVVRFPIFLKLMKKL